MKVGTKNYKTDSNNREVKEFTGYVKGEETKIKAKINKEGDIWEYVSGVPEELVGEQLYTWQAVERLGLEERLPKYSDFKLEDSYGLFPGYWNPYYKKFFTIGEQTDCWLSDGYYVALDKDYMTHYYAHPEFGFSLHLLKELDQNSTI